MKYHVVRLDYAIIDSKGNFHQTHHFSSHRLLSAAQKAAREQLKKINCVDIVDDAGKKVEWES